MTTTTQTPATARAAAAEAEANRLRATIERMQAELDLFKPQPMSQRCRDGKHNGTGDYRCVNCWCLCHRAEAEIYRLRTQLAQQIKATRTVDDLRMAEIGQLRAELAALRALAAPAFDEAADDRDERARFARQEGRTDEERGHLDTASQYRAERDRQEAGQPECVITGASWEKPGDCTTHAHRGTSGPPLTHFFGCWRFPEHHGCAVELIQRQSEENAQLIGEKGHLERQLRDHQEVGGEPG